MRTGTFVRSSAAVAALVAGTIYLVWFWLSAFTVIAEATKGIAVRLIG